MILFSLVVQVKAKESIIFVTVGSASLCSCLLLFLEHGRGKFWDRYMDLILMAREMIRFTKSHMIYPNSMEMLMPQLQAQDLFHMHPCFFSLVK